MSSARIVVAPIPTTYCWVVYPLPEATVGLLDSSVFSDRESAIEHARKLAAKHRCDLYVADDPIITMDSTVAIITDTGRLGGHIVGIRAGGVDITEAIIPKDLNVTWEEPKSTPTVKATLTFDKVEIVKAGAHRIITEEDR